jgi:hypothetical protein
METELEDQLIEAQPKLDDLYIDFSEIRVLLDADPSFRMVQRTGPGISRFRLQLHI